MRQQRHLGTRVVIATQEPTISPSFLDLCNVTIIHRFTSPAGFKAIKAHLAGATASKMKSRENDEWKIFRRIVRLATGEALLFCPTGLLDTMKSDLERDIEEEKECELSEADEYGSKGGMELTINQELATGEYDVLQLGSGHVHLRVRRRITVDGGQSLMEK